MKKRKKLSKTERIEISILIDKRYSIRSIAKAMNRSSSTICREIERNTVKGIYEPKKAQHKAYVRKKYSRFEYKKINENKKLKEFVIKRLKNHWNPDEISGYLRKNDIGFYVSKTAIYDWLYSTQGIPYCRYLYSKRYTRKKRVKKTKRMMISQRVSINKRFLGADNRTRYGHIEADTVVSGKRGRGALLVSIDRKSRYVNISKINTLRPQETTEALKRIKRTQTIRSMTLDNGIENRYHRQIGIPTFFCDPYSSWQKGSVENVNRMIRRYIPKGTNISKISDEYIKKIEEIINKKPRKVLGYKSAYDVMMEKGLLREGVAIEG